MDLTLVAVALIGGLLGFLVGDRRRAPNPDTTDSSPSPIAHIAVDSGMVWIGDPVTKVVPERDAGWQPFVEKALALGFAEEGIAAFESAQASGSLGVAVNTGGIDGVFPVFVRRGEDGLIAEVRVVFDEGVTE